jgi:DNA-binding CsgD family transcriptional regulator
MNDFLRVLSLADSPGTIHEATVRHVWDHLPASSVHFMPLVPRTDGQQGSVLYHRKDLVDEILATVAQSVQALQAEPDLPDLFTTPRRVIRVEEALGWNRWLRSAIYQDFFRRDEASRQLVVGLVDRHGAPRAFLAVCRSESDAAITREEEEQLLCLRDRVEGALAAFDLVADWAQPSDAILEALAAGLPLPALVLNGERILWMNDEAKLRLGMAALAFGGSTFYVGQSRALAELMACVQAEITRPGAALAQSQRQYTWLLPGESILVRRLPGGESSAPCLVCLNSPAPAPSEPHSPEELQRAHQLTTREADITRLAIEGFSVLSISSRLNIAESTVCTHLKRVYRKLGVRSRAELVWRIASLGPSRLGPHR